MKTEIVAVILQVGGKICSDLLRLRSHSPKQISEAPSSPSPPAEPAEVTEEIGDDKIEKGTACLPCINGHFSVCSGLISDEALRMARRHGITHEEISRINKCLDQLNAMEREDLSIDKIEALPQWEKELAIYAQNESAAIRHKLEHLNSVDDLEDAALRIKVSRTKIGQEYFRGKLSHLKKEVPS